MAQVAALLKFFFAAGSKGTRRQQVGVASYERSMAISKVVEVDNCGKNRCGQMLGIVRLGERRDGSLTGN